MGDYDKKQRDLIIEMYLQILDPSYDSIYNNNDIAQTSTVVLVLIKQGLVIKKVQIKN
jgi:hypothetical protein